MNQAIARLLARLRPRTPPGVEEEPDYPEDDVLDSSQGAADADFLSTVEPLINQPVLFSHVNQAEQREPFYRRLLALTEQRLGREHILTLKANMNLATVYAYQDRFDEAVSLAEQILPVLRRESSVYDDELTVALGNLELWYRNAGRVEDADQLIEEQRERLPLCNHLKPLEEYILAAGGKVTGRGRWGGVIVSIDAYLDVASLQQGLDLAACVEVSEISDPHYGLAKGLACTVHRDAIWGQHPTERERAPVIAYRRS